MSFVQLHANWYMLCFLLVLLHNLLLSRGERGEVTPALPSAGKTADGTSGTFTVFFQRKNLICHKMQLRELPLKLWVLFLAFFSFMRAMLPSSGLAEVVLELQPSGCILYCRVCMKKCGGTKIPGLTVDLGIRHIC